MDKGLESKRWRSGRKPIQSAGHWRSTADVLSVATNGESYLRAALKVLGLVTKERRRLPDRGQKLESAIPDRRATRRRYRVARDRFECAEDSTARGNRCGCRVELKRRSSTFVGSTADSNSDSARGSAYLPVCAGAALHQKRIQIGGAQITGRRE